MVGGLIRDTGRYLLAGASGIAILALSTSAEAQDNAAIQAQIQALQSQINSLQKQVGQAQAAAAAAQKSKSDELDLKIRWRGAPEFSSGDGKFKMKVRGRLMVDYNAINQDQQITGFPDVSAAEMRRARIGVEGVVFYDVAYKLEVDFAGDTAEIKDAYLEYTGLAEGLGIRAGNYKPYNSLDELTSSRYITFMERAAFVEGWDLNRHIGVGFFYGTDHFTLGAGAFGPASENQEIWLKDTVRLGAARLTLAPINSDEGIHKVVHFGASWRSRHQAEDNRDAPLDPFEDQFFEYRARGADLHLAERFISTPEIFEEDTFWGLEGAVIWQQFHVVGEYTQLKGVIDPLFAPGPDPTYNGYYIEAGWFLTGETRGYDEGEFARVKVKNPVFGGSRGWGAWQIAGRYDVLDLTDKAKAIADCELCGEQKTWLIGVNWHLNDYTRVMFNYNQSDIGGGALVKTNGDISNLNSGAKIKGFGMRAQVDW